ncbi:MAG: hypothetical protein LKE50_04220 [Atopobiaceae bacterium]|nr:hypothetical protein [Atopobiaceae bacterium]
MAEDFGDDAGQQLYEWTMRIGPLREQAPRGGLVPGAGAEGRRQADGLRSSTRGTWRPMRRATRTSLPEYAKLDLHEFKELDDFPAVRSAIDARLSSDGLPPLLQ